jgi:hypothetical protein
MGRRSHSPISAVIRRKPDGRLADVTAPLRLCIPFNPELSAAKRSAYSGRASRRAAISARRSYPRQFSALCPWRLDHASDLPFCGHQRERDRRADDGRRAIRLRRMAYRTNGAARMGRPRTAYYRGGFRSVLGHGVNVQYETLNPAPGVGTPDPIPDNGGVGRATSVVLSFLLPSGLRATRGAFF